jgi:DNA-binding response OmpR family regulator
MQKILIIEDDIGISESLKLYLENSDFEVEVHRSGEGASEKVGELNPDLVILDINLPKKSGVEVCSEIRLFSAVPVVMLTAQSSEGDKIIGFESGADDYIAKPFSPRELLARIQSILRRYTKEAKAPSIEKNILTFWNIEIQLEKALVKIDGSEVFLTKNEYDILTKVVEYDGKLVSRDVLMKEVIGYDNYIYDRTIDTHVKNLRKKLGENEVILTVRGKWYRLNK